MIFELFPTSDTRDTNRQLQWMLEAIHEAKANHAEGVATCIRKIAELG